MRIRTLVALVTGAAAGASAVWLLDPETGRDRRRDVVRTAWERSREVDWSEVLARAGVVAQELGAQAAEGYQQGMAAKG